MRGAFCPECGFEFQGPGYIGIDSHWKNSHSETMAYKTAWPLIKSGKYKNAKAFTLSATAGAGMPDDQTSGNRAEFAPSEFNVRCLERDWRKLDIRSRQYRYCTERDWAWRNVLVAAINAGVDQRLFGTRPSENWWEDWEDKEQSRKSCVYYFEIAPGIPGIASVSVANRNCGKRHFGMECWLRSRRCFRGRMARKA